MYNGVMVEEREHLYQRDIDVLEEISEKHGGTLVLPPVFGSLNVCILTNDIKDLTIINESLFFDGFSFVQKMNGENSYIEILSVHDFS